MPNHPIIDTEVAAPSLASLEFETKIAQLFIKEFMSLKENLEDFLEENYIWANKRLVSISESSEINKLKRSIEKSIQPRSKEFQKCLTLNVKNVPSISSLIPSSEISLYLNSNLPKTLGSYINKKKNTTIYITGETRLSINLRDNKVYIKESETIKPTALVLIEGKKVLESYDRFRVGTTIFDFELKFEQSIELRCTKEGAKKKFSDLFSPRFYTVKRLETFLPLIFSEEKSLQLGKFRNFIKILRIIKENLQAHHFAPQMIIIMIFILMMFNMQWITCCLRNINQNSKKTKLFHILYK